MEQAENPSSSRGYYCHNCNNTISLPITNFLCPDCHQGFIEKLPDGPASSSSFNDRNGENRDDMDSDPVVVLNRVFDDISNNLDVIMGGGESNARNSDNRASSSNRRDATTHPSRPNDRRRGRNQPAGTFEQVLSGLLSNMSRNAQTFDGNGPVLLVGNPGDYAWGHEGLDTIVTQLLNQMDSSGPPPLAQDKIKELPFVSITAQQVSENIQCSVCWDSFKMTEKVRQLPCDHIYHDLCIVPWLELHGTCPICRKLLSEDNEGRLGFPHTGGLEALLSDVHGFSILQRSYAPSTTNRRSQIRCYRCHNRGHYARECDQRSMSANSSRRGPFQNVTGARDYPSHRHSPSQRSFLGAGATESTNQRRSSTRDSRRGASSTRSYSNHRHSPSRAVPMHEFLEEFDVEGDFLTDSDDFYGSDLDDLSDVVPCEVCGLTRDDHHDFPGSSPDTWLPYDFGDRATVSSGWGSPMSANFAGFGATSGQTDQQPRVNNGRKRKTLTCYNCKKPGHMARDCWYNNKCSHCSKNHKSSDCWHAPNRTVPSSGFRTGTDVRSSPRNFNPETNRFNRYSDGSGPSTSRFREPNSHDRHQCFHCREFGHIARNCPAAPKRNTNAGRVRLCHSCGREGHFSRECPVNF